MRHHFRRPQAMFNKGSLFYSHCGAEYYWYGVKNALIGKKGFFWPMAKKPKKVTAAPTRKLGFNFQLKKQD
jgi:hypothetical protein